MARKPNSGLNKWFNEEWVDVTTGEPCGRPSKTPKGKKRRKYPACRPKKVAQSMSEEEKAEIARKKRGRRRVSWKTTPSGRKKKS